MILRATLLILLVYSPLIELNSQSQFPIKIAIGNEATAVPFTKLLTNPIHPTLQVGTEYIYKNKPHSVLYQTANLGYIFHKYLYQGVYINTGIGYDYKTNFGINLKTNFEIGYLRTFATQDEYQLQNGEYQQGNDKGNSRIAPTFSIGIGYSFKKEEETSSEVFILYKTWIEYPYSPGFIPLMSHTNLEIGYKFYLKGHKNESH